MKKWLRRILLYLVSAFLVLNLFCALALTYAPPIFFQSLDEAWARVYLRIQSSNEHIDSDTLYVGDSVAGQLFPFNSSNQLTTNGSVLAAGNYMLIANALEANPHLTTVFYMCLPQTIGHDINRKRTCNNFVKPFLTPGQFSYLDKSITSALDRQPIAYLYLLPAYRFAPIDEVDFTIDSQQDDKELSDFSIHWLKKIYQLCQSKKVKLILASPPVAEHQRDKYQDWKAIRAQVASDPMLEQLFNGYFSTIHYYPDQYLRDKIHWQEAFLEQNRERITEQLYKDVGTAN